MLEFVNASQQNVLLSTSSDIFQNVTDGTIVCWAVCSSDLILANTERLVYFANGTSASSVRASIVRIGSVASADSYSTQARRLDADGATTTTSSGDINTTGFRHLVADHNWNGTSHKLYEDLSNTGTSSPAGWTASTSNTASLRAEFGGANSIATTFFGGTMGRVKLYKSVTLTAAEMAEEYYSLGRNFTLRGIVGYYPMREKANGGTASGSGSVKNAVTGGAPNGTANNSPVYRNSIIGTRKKSAG